MVKKNAVGDASAAADDVSGNFRFAAGVYLGGGTLSGGYLPRNWAADRLKAVRLELNAYFRLAFGASRHRRPGSGSDETLEV
jgi:hypothetical protein